MRKLIVLSFLALTSMSLVADTARATDGSPEDGIILDGESVDLNEFLWIKRPIVVFADNASDPRFIEQMNFITDRLDEDARDHASLSTLLKTGSDDFDLDLDELFEFGLQRLLDGLEGWLAARG